MSFPSASVIGVGLWMPGYPSARAWLEGRRDAELEVPTGAMLDRKNRRRAGVLTRALADAAAEAMNAAGVDASAIPVVIGSAIGEVATMIGLLDQLWHRNEPLSPAEFTVSVHNAASALISISSKNRGLTTSLAADEDTPAAALLEGLCLVQTRGEPVLVACGDEAIPPRLSAVASSWSLLASSLVLAPPGAAASLAELEIALGAAPELPVPEFDALTAANPQVGLAWLVDAVLRKKAGSIPLAPVSGRGFTARLSFGRP